MKLLKKRKFRMALYFLFGYLSLVAFSLAASNRAPIRNNESMIITDYRTGVELETIPYGNHSFKAAVKDSIVLHAPVSLMSGQSFHVKYRAILEGETEAKVTADLSAPGYDLSSCSFTTDIKEGKNMVEGDLVFDGVNHPQTAEINIYSSTPGVEITIAKPHFTRTEEIRVGYLAYTALIMTFIFMALGAILLIRDRRQTV
ncbi:hypothetical protein [Butyrivibrio sp. INlla16]|uniref:hypothetical protein n=1 Tax=Butyrivibrio sp. INlla16 TaxID=1520807 RepID=UPI00087FFE9B|nr:hypothetical protein [Butyrivibrio sp. INlla16]SDB18838.1 hypothetical protein SAMN02910263_00881 [Butyrivibrio sp. INlla16]